MHNNEAYHVYPINFELEQRYSRLLRAACIGHDSLGVGVWAKAKRMLHSIRRNSVFRSQSPAPSRGFTIVGKSGIGKWRAL
jgi:hypothetical protein